MADIPNPRPWPTPPMQAFRTLPRQHRGAPPFGAPVDRRADDSKVLTLLMPIKRASDVIYGARYAKRLREWGIRVKVNLLHVTPTERAEAVSLSGPPRREREEHAEELMREAALYLSRSWVEHSTFIFSGEVLFSILDAAELLDCQEIVLPAAKPGQWRLFSADLARRIARCNRGATVVLAAPNGVSCPAHAA